MRSDTALPTPSGTMTSATRSAAHEIPCTGCILLLAFAVGCSGAASVQSGMLFEPRCLNGHIDLDAGWDAYCAQRLSAEQMEQATRFLLDMPPGCTNWPLFSCGSGCTLDWYAVMDILRAEQGCATPVGTAACRTMYDLRWSGSFADMYATRDEAVQRREQFDLYCSCPEVMEMGSARRREARLRIEALEAAAPRPLESSGVEPGSE